MIFQFRKEQREGREFVVAELLVRVGSVFEKGLEKRDVFGSWGIESGTERTAPRRIDDGGFLGFRESVDELRKGSESTRRNNGL